MLSRFENAIQRVEKVSNKDDIEQLNELNRRYIKLCKLFVDIGFCEMCPVHIHCDIKGIRCERMLEWWLSKE